MSTKNDPRLGDTSTGVENQNADGDWLAQSLSRLIRRIDAAEQVRKRIIQDAISDVHASQLRRRARAFLAAVQEPGEYPGGPVDWETGAPGPVNTEGWCPVCGSYFLSSTEAIATGCCVGLPIIDGRREGPDCRGKDPRPPLATIRRDPARNDEVRGIAAALAAKATLIERGLLDG
ncbi:hypothetical protein AADG42_10115 [Ammonicoccus fulvus]|uniref:Uncharacterized protein n=1 Tax=Ammonicoccus fulvus TaxID=3138240 RepID=A0ABZ3FPM3_9ACTN